MSSKQKNKQNAERAKFMHEHPNQFPDSVMRPHQGVGSGERKLARVAPKKNYMDMSTGQRGMLGGILAHKIGYPCEITKQFL